MRRSRRVTVTGFDTASNRWVRAEPATPVACDALTVTTFNIWFDEYHADARYRAIAGLLAREMPDVMVFQEVTPAALAVFLAQPWIRRRYRSAEVTGGDLGNYGMLLLSRLPLTRVTYTPLPTRLARGYLTAELAIDGTPLVVAAIHLESGKAAAGLRARQLRQVYRSLRRSENVVVLGDFNMRDAENGTIGTAHRDVWPELRPDDDGFTEDTSINLTRLDSKGKHRQVRFDRVLLRGDSWKATGIDLLGTEPISAAQPRVFPSDHFGVRCHLERGLLPEVVRRQRLWRLLRS